MPMIYGSGPSGRIHRKPQRLPSDEQLPVPSAEGQRGKCLIRYAGTTYQSMAAAARAMGVSGNGLWSAIDAGRRTVKGKPFVLVAYARRRL